MTAWSLERMTALLRRGGVDIRTATQPPEPTAPVDPLDFIIPSTLNIEALDALERV